MDSKIFVCWQACLGNERILHNLKLLPGQRTPDTSLKAV